MIVDMLRRTAVREPDSVAIVCGERRLTYGQLEHQASAFGAYLTSVGVRPGDVLMLLLDNCPEFVVAYFSTAVVGAKVISLDPALGEPELRRVFRQHSPAAVVTDAARVPLVDHLVGPEPTPAVIVVDEPATARRAFAAPVSNDGSEGRAVPTAPGPWVYARSSGSTGEPRTVCRSQANQFHEADNIVTTAAVTVHDTILCPVPLFHALGQFCCMLVAVRAGATLVLLPRPDEGADGVEARGAATARKIIDTISRERVTILLTVPFLLETLVDEEDAAAADLSSLRLCLSGSNFLRPELRGRFRARFGMDIRQTYGSTETGSVSWDCAPGDAVPESVGAPLRGVHVEILDLDGQVLRSGAVGEIAVTSQAVMLGYEYDEPAGGGSVAGSRRHRTGDLGWLDESGRLHLAGRKRALIDTGGHKVNPVEVEEILERHADVSEAVVVGTPAAAGDTELVAVAVRSGDVTESELLAHCRTSLAAYQVPHRVTFVEGIPVTALGKPRRAHIAATLQLGATSRAGELSPDSVERLVSAAVAEVTGRQSVDLGASASDHGVDSIGYLRLRMAVRKELGHSIRLSDMYDLSLGALIERLTLAEDAEEEPAPRAHGPRSTEFPLSPAQRSIWDEEAAAGPAAADTNNQLFAARITSPLDVDALHRAFQSLVDRHPGLRTTYGVAHGEPFQRVARSASVDFAAVDVASHDQWDEKAAILAEGRRPFDLTRELPIRVRLLRGGAAGAVLLVVQHHIAVDFWSLVLALRHVGTAYVAELAGAESTVAASPFTYGDYVHWLRELAASTIETRNRGYWSARLARPLPAIALPGDRPQVDDSAARGASYFHELGDDVVAELARTDGRSVFQVALTALVALLHEYSGESDIGVAVTTSDRLRAEFDEVLGNFVSSAILRVEVDGVATLGDLCDTVCAELDDVLDHRPVPQAFVAAPGNGGSRVRVAFNQNKSQYPELLPVAGFHISDERTLRLGNLMLESISLRTQGLDYDLAGTVYESERSIVVGWNYNAAMFGSATMARFSRQFERTLRAVVAREAASLSEIRCDDPREP